MRGNVIKLYEEAVTKLKEDLAGSKVVIAFDGWKNTVTADKHSTFVIFKIDQKRTPIFWTSFLNGGQGKIFLKQQCQVVISSLRIFGAVPIGIIADNCRAGQTALNEISEEDEGIGGFRCGAHLWNLVIKHSFLVGAFLGKSARLLQWLVF